MVETFGTATVDAEKHRAGRPASVFDLRPAAIIERLDLRRPIYRRTAAYGHFGRARTSPGSRLPSSTSSRQPLASDGCRRPARRPGPARRRGHRQGVRLPRSRRAGAGACGSAPWCASTCTGAASAAGSWRTRSTPPDGRHPQAHRQGHRLGPAAPTSRPGALGRVAVGRPPRRHPARCVPADRGRQAQPRGERSARHGGPANEFAGRLRAPLSVVRMAPAADAFPLVLAAAPAWPRSGGDPVGGDAAGLLGARLRRGGASVAVHPAGLGAGWPPGSTSWSAPGPRRGRRCPSSARSSCSTSTTRPSRRSGRRLARPRRGGRAGQAGGGSVRARLPVPIARGPPSRPPDHGVAKRCGSVAAWPIVDMADLSKGVFSDALAPPYPKR